MPVLTEPTENQVYLSVTIMYEFKYLFSWEASLTSSNITKLHFKVDREGWWDSTVGYDMRCLKMH